MTPRQLLKRLFPPMLATLASDPPPDDANWTFEWKYDGFRAVIALSEGEVAFLSRNELDLSGRFPRTNQVLEKLSGKKEMVVDGEVVVLDASGAPRFQLLQQGGNEQLILFDILWLDGQDLRGRPYTERRRLLEKAFSRPPAGISIAGTLEMSGEQALEQARKAGWEGIIAKKNSSVYESRRSKQWLKIKAINEQELVVVGWQPSSASEHEIGSLHLGFFDDQGDLRYAGKVGTGFSSKLRAWFLAELAKDTVDQPPVVDAPRIRSATWVRPRFVAQVSFTEWTSDNRLRHPSFLGLREDKRIAEVVREKPVKVSASGPAAGKSAAAPRKKSAGKASKSSAAKSSKSSAAKGSKSSAAKSSKASAKSSGNAAGKASRKGAAKSASEGAAPSVTLTNPGRLLYPREGITKQDVADYYEAVAGPMLRALADRPLSLEHWNQGVGRPPWFQQNIGREGPPWLNYIDTPARTSGRDVRHLAVDSVESLRWLAQMSVLTVHMWASRGQSLEEPDWIVFDLDPAKGKGIEQAIEAALVMRKVLETLELPSVPKTSGKRGIHVFVPLEPGYSHEEAGAWSCSVAAAVAARVPYMTVERSLSQRRGRLYLDCMQNAYGKTIVAPYSLRGIDGAPVSAPLKWSEITKKLDPMKFNLRTMPARLAKVGDLFAEVLKTKAKLPRLQ